MRPYEVMIILDSAVDESTVQTTLDRIRDLLASKNGKLGNVEKWGRRRFAYEMNHRLEGYYALAEFTAEPADISELDRVLTLTDEVVRHKVVRIPDSVAGRKKPTSSPEPVAEAAGAAENTGEQV